MIGEFFFPRLKPAAIHVYYLRRKIFCEFLPLLMRYCQECTNVSENLLRQKFLSFGEAGWENLFIKPWKMYYI
jgi:hypothetical protein